MDFLEATPSGMNRLHGTAIAIYQAKSFDDPPLLPPLKINRSPKATTMDESFESVLLTCKKPDPPKIKLACTLSDSQPLIDANKTKDLAWLVGCTNIEQSEIEDTGQKQAPGTWSAFNSLLSEEGCLMNVSLVPPLIRSPPTQYDTFYTAFMRIHDIASRVMGPGKKIVVTLDLQLYDMAMRLWIERADIRDKFLFRPGELHVALWALTALGKYVEGSGPGVD